MKNVKFLALAALCFCFVQVAQAQKEIDVKLKYNPSLKCANPTGTSGMSISYKQITGQKGKVVSVPISVRTPSKSNEVYDFNDGTNNPRKLDVSCFPLSKGAKVKEISFQDVTVKTPAGSKTNSITIYTNAKDFKAGPGEKLCVKISGVPDKPGKYEFIFNMKVKASLGLTINAKCTIKNGYVVIK